MIDNLIAFSIRNKLIIGVFTLAMVIWGIFSFRDIPIDAVPDITNNQVQVITLSPTLAAQEVEQFITLPIEIAMANIPDVIEIRSISRFGISVITVVFEENKDIYLARQLITEQLKMAEEEIPDGLGNPELAPISTGLGEILQYVLFAEEGYEDQYSAMDLRTINDWIVKRQLAGIPGIIEVNGWGGFLKEYEISVNPEKLKSMDITIADVFEAVQNNNENTGGSYIEKKFNTYFIRAEGLVSSLEDIEKIVVKTVQNTPIFIRDVAEVKYGSAPRYGAVTRNGHGEVVVGIAMMLKGENSDKVITDVKERITTIRGSLPEGVILEPFLDRSELIGRSMNTVTKNLVEGGLIVIFILIMLLGNFRAGLIVASVIPLSMMFAMGMMRLFGVSANLMSLGAIDFGLIVDGAVIIVESIVHRLKTNFSGQKLTASQMNKEVRLSSQKTRKSAAFGEIIILMVYIPILALVGIEGKMFKPMAQTVSFAIFGALILSLTYVPMMSAFFLSKKIHSRVTIADRIIGRLQKWYRPIIELALRFKAGVIIFSLVLFGMSVFTFTRMGGEFIPTLEEGDFALHQILPPGTSLAQGIEISTKLETILKEKFPEVDMVVTKIGSAEIPTDPMPIEVGDLMVKMKPKSEWVSASTRDEMFEKMEKELSVVPGVGFEFTQPIQMRFNELMTGVRQDIAVKIYGEDLDLLYMHAKEAESIIKDIQGVGDIKVEQIVGMPQIIIDYDRSKVAQYGLNVKDLNTLVRTAFAGEKAGVVFENERRFDIVVRLESNYRDNIEDIRNLYVALPNGSQVPLKEVANIDFKEAPMQISRDNTKRRITIGINARNRDVETLVEEIQDKLETELVLPAGYYLKYGGQFENLVAAKKRLSVAVPITLALIFILLFFTFNSIKQALLIFSAIPLAAIGGVYALWLRDMPFSISAGVGFIALFGVAVLNGIVLIAYFNQLKKEGMTDIRERILIGTNIRLRPVIMTASVAAFGFLPMALSQSAGAEVQRPLATVVIGGLITATFLTLVVLPVLYSIFTERIHIGDKTTNTILILLFAGTLALPISSNAQQMLTMDEAVQLAISNNQEVKAASLEVEKQQILTNTVLDFDNTVFSFGFGELNSTAFDFELSISQGFKMPKVYKQRSALQDQNIALSEKKLGLTRHELIHNVRSAYIDLVFRQAKKQLVIELDDIFDSFMDAVEKKRKAGESNALEKIIAQTKVQEVSLMLQEANAEISIARQELKKWLNSSETIKIDQEFKKIDLLPSENSRKVHPALQYFQQSISVTEQAQQLEKTNILPDFSIGYFNQQIDGITGFDGIEAVVSLPIWRKVHKAQLQASEIDIQIARTEYENVQLQLSLMIEKKIQEFKKYEEMVMFFENESLKLSEELIRVATKNYRVREIDFMDYIRNLEQAIEIKTNYLDALNSYNQAIIDLWYLEGK